MRIENALYKLVLYRVRLLRHKGGFKVSKCVALGAGPVVIIVFTVSEQCATYERERESFAATLSE